ncbi:MULTISPECIES: hypothetical protein [Streptomyces]|uniref:hypothetical protein n=1 Tax=Streptomyces scabiei TaxID=1930 RepID=UPI00059FB556|nr:MULTISPECIES: hypothetical protein [Streptomyces]QTU64786.1 hypothetical protein F3K22_30690 [Streptomyces sp. LBUM 1475]MBP5878565.1 hypothetical protein [Streptomyces sp. LBUM 1477]MBP5890890.1 hypothetical protein [Streptomyces sp. LBUM 1481]MBP5921031.1 hypothetical protein [Streptomyces sp. LBUM 1483]MDX2871946.1 hypothetical protein [Streptomyces scabiei]
MAGALPRSALGWGALFAVTPAMPRGAVGAVTVVVSAARGCGVSARWTVASTGPGVAVVRCGVGPVTGMPESAAVRPVRAARRTAASAGPGVTGAFWAVGTAPSMPLAVAAGAVPAEAAAVRLGWCAARCTVTSGGPEVAGAF